MSEIPGDFLDANEADALEQAQTAVDGDLDDPREDIEAAIGAGPLAGWDADEADIIEQTQTVAGSDEDYPEG